MALDELTATIETIKQRIKDHRTSLAANETRTRQVLIDPLLAALGWDVTDPDTVALEYKIGGGFADYALLADGKPVTVIEAKKLNESLESHMMQLLNYAVSEGVKYMILTDGDKWRMYDVFKQVPNHDKLVMQMTISTDQTYENALNSLMIWNDKLIAQGDAVDSIQPVVGSDRTSPSPTSEPLQPTPEEEWQSITDKFPDDARPFAVKFGGSETEVASWKELAVEFATWMVNEGKITPEECPVQTATNSNRYYINTQPIHSDDSPFERPTSLPSGMWLDAFHVDPWWIRNTRILAQRFREDLSVKIGK